MLGNIVPSIITNYSFTIYI